MGLRRRARRRHFQPPAVDRGRNSQVVAIFGDGAARDDDVGLPQRATMTSSESTSLGSSASIICLILWRTDSAEWASPAPSKRSRS